MADKRKLQAEIEKCLKKVTEGIETFDEIWQKVNAAANANQKEKYEADLKKEIKKLQRLRDNIKTWMQSNDIKDKKSLADARKNIETRMERFKVIERETKTKAYSKEGLGLATKIDPAQKEKEEMRQWLTDSIDSLQMQIDQFESEIESVGAGSKRKKLDKDRQDRIDELTSWVERHKFHIQKLETIMRMLDNCSMESDDVKSIQDDLQYYIESNQEPDFAENELLYEDLNLDDGPSVVSSNYHNQPFDEDGSSMASSPSSTTGPLSPKTPNNPSKSTSLEMFSDRRRGKSISSDLNEPVPSSPRRPGPKSLSLSATTPSSSSSSSNNSNNGSKGFNSASKATVSSAKLSSTSRTPTQSMGGTLPFIKPLSLSTTSSSNSVTKVQSLSAYATAAGSQTPVSTSTSTVGSSISATVVPVKSTSSHVDPVASSSDSHSSSVMRLQDSSAMSQESQSSSSSSLSPSSLVPSQDSGGQPALVSTNSGSGSVPHASQDSSNNVSGPPSQATNSPNLSTYMNVSENTSPIGSPNFQQVSSLSPTVNSVVSVVSHPNNVIHPPPPHSSTDSFSSRSNSSSGSESSVTPSLSTAAVVMSLHPSGLISSNHKTTEESSVDLMFGSSMPSLPLSGNPPSVVTSFPLQPSLNPSESSFSPSLSSLEVSSVTGNSTSVTLSLDSLAFPNPTTANKEGISGWPSPPITDTNVGMTSLKDIAAEVVASHDLLGSHKHNHQLTTTDQSINIRSSLINAAPGTRIDAGMFSTLTTVSSSKNDGQMQPLLGVAPLGPIPLNQDRMYQLKMLEAVFKHLPEPSDSERVRPYLQRTPYLTPTYHHQHPPGHMDSFEFYQRLSIETLFFIFYYMEGTKAQYMAAKALKKLSWRFHTKYMTWFQRLEEPKTITDDYEMGTYIYFDYEKWAQRKKDGFTFEYRYLEDKELP